MIDAVLNRKNVAFKTRFSVKILVSVCLIALAIILPQLVHIAFGSASGARWLPMYLPVLVGGCLLGAKWGFAVGVFSPIISFWLTWLISNPMPTALRLPYMSVELAVFALVCGAYSKPIVKNKWFAFPAVWSAQIAGRAVFLGLTAILQNIGGISFAMAWSQIKVGAMGIAIQAAVVPVVIIALRYLLLERD